jgi:hypothetical protein
MILSLLSYHAQARAVGLLFFIQNQPKRSAVGARALSGLCENTYATCNVMLPRAQEPELKVKKGE